jgi:hypothetical protein
MIVQCNLLLVHRTRILNYLFPPNTNKMFAVLKRHPMKTCGGMELQLHIFLTSALYGGEWPDLQSSHFSLGKRVLGTKWTGG